MITLPDFIACVRAGIIPPDSPDIGYSWEDRDLDSFRAKDVANSYGMWAMVDMKWTKDLAEWIGGRKVLEVMAGAGWLAKALSDHGVDIIATDDSSWDERHTKMKRVFNVEKMDAVEAVKKIEADVLIISWPPYGDSTILEVCEAWGREKPIIYIGEFGGGCNAPEEFFENFDIDDDAPDFDMKRWSGIYDRVMIGYYVEGGLYEV